MARTDLSGDGVEDVSRLRDAVIYRIYVTMCNELVLCRANNFLYELFEYELYQS